MKKQLNILFTSVGRRSYLIKYFKEALGDTGKIHVANSIDASPAFKVADYSVVTPLIYSENYIQFLFNYCENNGIDAIISLFDIDLPVLARYKQKFMSIGTTIIVSAPDKIEICNDKWSTFIFLKKNGFQAPETYISLEKAIFDLKSSYVSYPVMVKPRWGMGSIGIFEADNEEELRIFYTKTKKKIQSSYLAYESTKDIDESVLIQEKINGQEYGLDVINNLKAEYQTTIVKMKCSMRAGETDCAIIMDNSQLKELGCHLGKLMGHIGNLDVDVILADDKCYILEMNARFGGGYPFSHMAGVNLPKAIIAWLRNEKIDSTILEECVGVKAQKDISMVIL